MTFRENFRDQLIFSYVIVTATTPLDGDHSTIVVMSRLTSSTPMLSHTRMFELQRAIFLTYGPIGHGLLHAIKEYCGVIEDDPEEPMGPDFDAMTSFARFGENKFGFLGRLDSEGSQEEEKADVEAEEASEEEEVLETSGGASLLQMLGISERSQSAGSERTTGTVVVKPLVKLNLALLPALVECDYSADERDSLV